MAPNLTVNLKGSRLALFWTGLHVGTDPCGCCLDGVSNSLGLRPNIAGGDVDVVQHRDPVWRQKSNFIIGAEITDSSEPATEQLWARQIDGVTFELCCIPFLLYNLALGDVVRTGAKAGHEYMVHEVVQASGRAVTRVWFAEAPELRDEVASSVGRLGALMEWSSTNLLAIDTATPPITHSVRDYLAGLASTGILVEFGEQERVVQSRSARLARFSMGTRRFFFGGGGERPAMDTSDEPEGLAIERAFNWGIVLVSDANSRDLPELPRGSSFAASRDAVVIAVRHAQDVDFVDSDLRPDEAIPPATVTVRVGLGAQDRADFSCVLALRSGRLLVGDADHEDIVTVPPGEYTVAVGVDDAHSPERVDVTLAPPRP